jgi:CheY-like chemotaxis protein
MWYGGLQQMGTTLHLNGIRVLVVDDDDDARELVGMMLTGAGAEVTLAGSGSEALETAARGTDVVLSDLNMINMGGVEFVSALRKLGHTVPCVAVTGFEKHAAMGFDAYLQKPIDGARLVKLVASLAAAAHVRSSS